MDTYNNSIIFDEETKTCNVSFIIHKSLILNANVPIHHMKKATIVKKLRRMSCDLFTQITQTKPLPVFTKFVVKVQICPPTKRRLDPPNLNPTVKPLLDGGTKPSKPTDVGAGMWDDDDYSRIIGLFYTYGGLSGIKDYYIINFTIKEILDSTCLCWLD